MHAGGIFILNAIRGMLRAAYENCVKAQGPASLLASAIGLVLNVLGVDFGSAVAAKTAGAAKAAGGGGDKTGVPVNVPVRGCPFGGPASHSTETLLSLATHLVFNSWKWHRQMAESSPYPKRSYIDDAR